MEASTGGDFKAAVPTEKSSLRVQDKRERRFYVDNERGREVLELSQRVALYPRVVKQLVKRATEMRSVSSGSLGEPIYAANLWGTMVKKTLRRGTNPSYDAKLCTN